MEEYQLQNNQDSDQEAKPNIEENKLITDFTKTYQNNFSNLKTQLKQVVLKYKQTQQKMINNVETQMVNISNFKEMLEIKQTKFDEDDEMIQAEIDQNQEKNIQELKLQELMPHLNEKQALFQQKISHLDFYQNDFQEFENDLNEYKIQINSKIKDCRGQIQRNINNPEKDKWYEIIITETEEIIGKSVDELKQRFNSKIISFINDINLHIQYIQTERQEQQKIFNDLKNQEEKLNVYNQQVIEVLTNQKKEVEVNQDTEQTMEMSDQYQNLMEQYKNFQQLLQNYQQQQSNQRQKNAKQEMQYQQKQQSNELQIMPSQELNLKKQLQKTNKKANKKCPNGCTAGFWKFKASHKDYCDICEQNVKKGTTFYYCNKCPCRICPNCY